MKFLVKTNKKEYKFDNEEEMLNKVLVFTKLGIPYSVLERCV